MTIVTDRRPNSILTFLGNGANVEGCTFKIFVIPRKVLRQVRRIYGPITVLKNIELLCELTSEAVPKKIKNK